MPYDHRRILALHRTNPAAVELAEAVSFAVQIEPSFLRAARRQLVPNADAGAEADVWLSSLVEARGPDGIVLDRDIAVLLRRELRQRLPDRFEYAWRLTRLLHRQSPAAIQLEEEINYTLTEVDDESKERVGKLLSRATATLVGNSQRQGIANWAARMLPRLPPEIRQLDSARVLAAAAYLRLANFVPEWSVEAGEDLQQAFANVLPTDLKEQPVRIRFIAKGVELAPSSTPQASEGQNVKVPATEPLLVEVSWEFNGQRESARVELPSLSQPQIVETTADEVQVRTLAGRRYRLTKEQKKEPPMALKRPTCFVLMAFGKKTDYSTGRVIDLDKTYLNIIKPAAVEAGYECLRADEIPHTGNIDVPMFKQILEADVVIADVSTSNPNVFYELGIRHALRPFTTLIIAEDQMMNIPLDVGQITIRKYRFSGDHIEFSEAQRVRKELSTALRLVGTKSETDSPVYTFLSELRPPELLSALTKAVASEPSVATGVSPSIAVLRDHADSAIAKSDFATAKALLSSLRSLAPNESWVIQKLALATYKAKLPTPEAALQEAIGILSPLNPRTSTDTETLGLWAAIHKRLWDLRSNIDDLDTAAWAYQKCFWLKGDYYSGINLAFLLDVRATQSPSAEGIADSIIAQRTRRQVIEICNGALQNTTESVDRYWILATAAEASVGLGDESQAASFLSQAKSSSTLAAWMQESTTEQIARLRDLLRASPLRKLPPQIAPVPAPG